MSDYDVIVVGFGAAGACAAIEAADAGAKVLVLDRGYGGGASALSGGVVYAGGGTHVQKEAGVEDSPDNMFRYLRQEVNGVVSDAVVRRYCETSPAMITWLEAQGVEYRATLCPYKTSYPTDEHYLYYSGNEKAWPYKLQATPAARGHRQVAVGMGSGAAFWNHLKDSALKKGVVFQPLARVDELVASAGRVVGLKYRKMMPTGWHRWLSKWAAKMSNWFPPIGRLLARRANAIWQRRATHFELRAPSVVLSAGGFIFNRQMVAQYAPAYLRVVPLGTEGDDGKGITLGRTAGGALGAMDRATCWRFLSPPPSFMEGIAVGKSGKRIINEDLYGATFSEKLVHDHGCDGFVIMDSESWQKGKQQNKTMTQPFQRAMNTYIFSVGHVSAPTLAELAAKIGVPAQQLTESVETYNTALRGGQGDPLHKLEEYCRPIERGPFYAVNLAPDASAFNPASGLTLGGLLVDDDTGAVKTESGGTIPGLYAAGRNAVGICANSYVSGLSLGDCVYTGRRAGKAAAEARSGSSKVAAPAQLASG